MPYWQNWQNSFLLMFKIASVKVRKRKNLVSVKKKTLFLQEVSVETCIAIFFKLAKICPKIFKQDMVQIRIWEKINIFKKAVFPRNYAPLDNWNAVLSILPKRFCQISGRNFCIDREKTWCFEKKCNFSVKNFLWKRWKMFKKPAEISHSRSEKNSVIKILFKKSVFPQNVDLAYNVKFWQLCWSFLSNLKNKPLKIRSLWVRSIIFKKFVFHQLFLGTYKMHFCQLCCKIFTENPEKFCFETEEDCEKTLFSKKLFFMKTFPRTK